MLFNTENFAKFFAFVLCIYWLFYKWRFIQNIVLLVAGGYFYYCFHKSFPIYLFCLITISYFSGILLNKIEKQETRKVFLVFTIVLLGTGLLYIKYSNLILGSIPGLDAWQASALHIIIPIGISYFTFSTIGYVVDVYRRKTVPEINYITYASYISFFPHILSGPIPSSSQILPQFNKTTIPNWEMIETSIGEILWGLFKKMVVADNIVMAVNYCFANYADQNGSTLFLGVTLFSLYLYADFSGYSDIARGTARLLGFDIARNFQMPFFSRNPAEFWRRWHSSLRKWMLDYLYLPIGGNKVSKTKYIFLILFIFSFSGLWHGANYTFICWGLLNGIYFLPYIFMGNLVRYKTPPSPGKWLPTLKEFLQMLLTFNLVTISRVFFRSPNIDVVKSFFEKIFSLSLFAAPIPLVTQQLLWCLPMLIVEWVQREGTYVLDMKKQNIYLRFCVYIVIIVAIYFLYKKQNTTEYYYFKF